MLSYVIVFMNNGTKLGPYEIIAPIGAGGTGAVYRAHDSRLGRWAAGSFLALHDYIALILRAIPQS